MVRSQARQQERRRLSEHVGFQLFPFFLLISFDVQDVVIDVLDFRVCACLCACVCVCVCVCVIFVWLDRCV